MTEVGAQLFVWALTAWVQGLIVFGLVWSAEQLGLLRGPALRQAAWRAVLILPLLSAAFQVYATGGPMTGATLLSPPPAAAAQAHAIAAAAAVGSGMKTVVDAQLALLLPVLGWAWLGWLGLAALRVAHQRRSLRAYRRRLMPISSPEIQALGHELARTAKVGRLSLLADPDLAGPIAIAPATVVVPSWVCRDLSQMQQRALLAHEISHLARRDPQWRAITALAAAVLLAPYGRLVRNRLEAVAEHACDAWAARRTDGGAALVQCLAACLERGLAARAPDCAAAMAETRAGVVERARRLVEGRTVELRQSVWRECAAGLGVFALISTLLPGFAIARPPIDAPSVAAPAPIAAPASPTLPVIGAKPAAGPAAPLKARRAGGSVRPAPPRAARPLPRVLAARPVTPLRAPSAAPAPPIEPVPPVSPVPASAAAAPAQPAPATPPASLPARD